MEFPNNAMVYTAEYIIVKTSFKTRSVLLEKNKMCIYN